MSALHTDTRPSPTDLSDTDAARPPAEADDRPRLLDLSLTQLVAGSMAAATAAALGSRIGVVGTITGAAIGSVVSAVAASLYLGSLTRARHVLRSGQRTDRVPGAWAADRGPTRFPWKPVAVTSAVVFALAGAFLTGVQLASGKDVTGTSIGTGPRTASTPQVERDGSGSRPDPASTGTPTPSTPATEPTTTPGAEPSTATSTETTTAPGPEPSPSTTTTTPNGEPTPTSTTGTADPTPAP